MFIISLIFSLIYHPLALLVESMVVGILVWIFVYRKTRHTGPTLTYEEEEALIDDWEPEPLVPMVDPSHFSQKRRIVNSTYGKYLDVDGTKCLNFATHNYLGMTESEECLKTSIDAVKKYGVGTCGPRNFFGNLDIHVELEKEIARFMGTEEAILYSYGFMAIASAIPAYAKANDIIFVDDGVYFAIQQGVKASRCTVRYFKHNNVEDLARLLKEQQSVDKKNLKLAKSISRFLVVEGLYVNHGDICPLKEMIALARAHKVRVLIDDSHGFGVLGPTGRGIVEHSEVNIEDIDLVAASLDYSAGAYGGFCTGSNFVIDPQRLAGIGYCFSASLPPLQTAFALQAIQLMQSQPEMFGQLRKKCIATHQLLKSASNLITVQGNQISPIKHLRFAESIEMAFQKRTEKHKSTISDQSLNTNYRNYDILRLEKVVQWAQEEGYCLTVSRYLDSEEHNLPPPSIRLIISTVHQHSELVGVVNMLITAFTLVQQQFYTGQF